jgi:prophage regulatory protein
MPKTPIRLLSPEQLRSVKGIDVDFNHLRRLIKRGEFPKPIQLTERKRAWRESDIDAWIQARASGEAA